MKRTIWISIAITFSVGLAWTAWMRLINTRVTQLSVQVAGDVESVRFYQKAKPDQVVAEILPKGQQGQAVEQRVTLPNARQRLLFTQAAPAQYYFVTEQAGERYQSPMICCETGFTDRHERLIIHGLADWEKQEQ